MNDVNECGSCVWCVRVSVYVYVSTLSSTYSPVSVPEYVHVPVSRSVYVSYCLPSSHAPLTHTWVHKVSMLALSVMLRAMNCVRVCVCVCVCL